MSFNLTEAESLHLESLDSRLAIVRDRVASVAHGYQNGLYLWGEGGIGKSYTVIRELERLEAPYRVTNSRLTGKGLYDLIEAHPDVNHVLEDVESLCADKNAAGVLRSALWSNSIKPNGRQERLVSWKTSGDARECVFTGGIILTMNMPLDDLPALRAIKTRIPYLRLEPTNAEVAALMHSIALLGHNQGGQYLDPESCVEVYEFIKATCDKQNRSYDLRMLVNACSDRLQSDCGHSETTWQDLVNSRLRERVVRSVAPETRAARIAGDRETAVEINSQNLTIADKLLLWKDRTGKGKQAYYDRLKEANGSTKPTHERPDTCVKPDTDFDYLADQFDFFATDPKITKHLLDRETFDGTVTEPCSGDGMIVDVLRERGYTVVASDLRDDGIVGTGGVNLHDLDDAENIVTNPPYTDLGKHVEHLVRTAQRKVACLLPLRFSGSKGRQQLLKNFPPARIYNLSERPVFWIGGSGGRKMSPGWDFAWFVWDRSYCGPTQVIYE